MTPEYHSHPEYVALIETVRTYPHDDAPRLILADWIQEHGDDERAEFIRLQIQRATLNRNVVDDGDDVTYLATCVAIQRLREREQELLTVDNKIRWLEIPEARRIKPTTRDLSEIYFKIGPDVWRGYFIRGFVAGITLSIPEFMTHAATLFTKHPITSVRLTNRLPYWDATLGHYTFFPSDHFEDTPYVIPAIFEPPPSGFRFATQRAAFDWLSRRCVAHGRQLVGLPPLSDEAEGSEVTPS